MFLHPLKQGVKGSRAYFVTMPSELVGYPLAINRPSFGVMQNVNLPEAQENLPGHFVYRRSRLIGYCPHNSLDYPGGVNVDRS